MAKKRWLQKAVKREGRFRGKNKQDLQGIITRLHNKAKKGKLTSAERSEMSAAQLGVRFKAGEFKKKVARAMKTGRIPR